MVDAAPPTCYQKYMDQTKPKTAPKGSRFSITVFPELQTAIEVGSAADGRSKSDFIERTLAKALKVKRRAA